ncbi:hypothetical protein EJB05_29094, partial [Eragrostis curvula]
MAWAMDAVVDATELWALDTYRGVARVRPTHPVVSLDEPHIVSFVVSESTVSHYFNASPSSSNCLETKSQAENASNNNNTAQSSSNSISSVTPKHPLKAASPAMMFAALEEIPSLAREDMLKAYRILCHDNTGRRFESLLGLPVSLRNG